MLINIVSVITAYTQSQPYELVLPDAGNLHTDFEKFTFEMAFADIDGDGDQDMVSAGARPGEISLFSVSSTELYINDGTGNFTRVENHGIEDLRGYPSFADIDGDGDQDLVIGGEINGDPLQWWLPTEFMKVYLNDGAGNFSEKTDHNLGGNFRTEFADIDGDSDLDVLILANSPVVYTNDGSGSFTIVPGTPFPTDKIDAGKFADLNGDTYPDLVLAGTPDGLFFNDGAGNFTAAASTPFIDLNFATVDVADVNGDTHLDVFIAGTQSPGDYAHLFINDGAGNLTDQGSYSFQSSDVESDNVSFKDLDGDLDIDFVLTGNNQTQIFFNNGAASFTPSSQIDNGQSAGDLELVDLDGDGDSDVVMSGLFQSGIYERFDNAVYINDGSGSFSKNELNNLLGVNNAANTLADIDNDGDLDLFITGSSNNSNSGSNFVDNQAILYLNDGNGAFTEDSRQTFTPVSSRAQSIVFADFNEDGWMDLLVGGQTDGLTANTTLYLNDQTGVLVATATTIASVFNPAVDVADVNGDNHLDVLIAGGNSSSQSTKLYLNDGAATFSESSEAFPGLADGTANFADLDGNGTQDIILSGSDATRAIKVYMNNGSGNFTENTSTSFTGVDDSMIAIEDIDGDNDMDFYITGNEVDLVNTHTSTSTAWLYTNDGTGSFTAVTHDLKAFFLGDAEFLDYDDDGDQDLFVGGYVNGVFDRKTKLYTNDGSGNFIDAMPLHSLGEMSIALGDIDGNGKNDMVITGHSGTDQTRIYKNITPSNCTVDDIMTDIVECDSYDFDGTTLTTSGIYNATFINTMGCDSLVTLNLTINPSFSIDIAESACGAYEFNGQTITTSRNYIGNFMTAQGCDSLVNLSLTIHEQPSDDIEANGIVLFAEDQTPGLTYQWLDCDNNGEPIFGETMRQLTAPRSGSYAVEISNQNCTVVSDCIIADLILGLDLDEHNNSSVMVYPTVSSGKIKIVLAEPVKNAELLVSTLSGATIRQYKYRNLSNELINIGAEDGVYLISVITKGKILSTYKVIIKN